MKCRFPRVNSKKGEREMKKTKRIINGFVTAGWIALAATPAFAKGFSLKDAGISLWIFIGIGATIILLQLIPAAILFFSFIGTGSAMAFRRKKASEQEKEAVKEVGSALPNYAPIKVEK